MNGPARRAVRQLQGRLQQAPVGQTIVFCGLPACGAGARSSHPEGESAEQLKVAALKRLSGDSRSRTAGFRMKGKALMRAQPPPARRLQWVSPASGSTRRRTRSPRAPRSPSPGRLPERVTQIRRRSTMSAAPAEHSPCRPRTLPASTGPLSIGRKRLDYRGRGAGDYGAVMVRPELTATAIPAR